MSSDKKRAPRAINLSKLGDSEAKPEAAKPKKSPAPEKPRKPRAASAKAVLVPVPEDAAQRRNEALSSQEQLAVMIREKIKEKPSLTNQALSAERKLVLPFRK